MNQPSNTTIDESLRAILQVLNSGKPLQDVLDFIAVRASEMMGEKTAVSIHRYDHNNHRSILEAEHFLPTELKSEEIKSLFVSFDEAASSREPVVLSDLAALRPEDFGLDNTAVFKTLLAYFQSYLAVPMIVSDTVIGGMAFHFPHKRIISSEDVKIAESLGDFAAIAIENARLHEAEQTRQRELQTLLDVNEAASSSLHLEETLEAAINRLLTLVDAERIGVIIFDDGGEDYVFRKVYPPRFVSESDWNYLMPISRQVVAHGAPINFAPYSAPGVEAEAVAFLPIQARGKTFGVLGIVGRPNKPFSPQQLRLFESVGSQMGVSVEHARLVEQAEETAVTQERNRLARELHDAVTQTLFSASLIADVLPRIWEKNQKQGYARLDELKELTRGALAEMRTLLLELRPATLVESSLSELLRQLTDAVVGRSRTPVELKIVGEERPLPPDTQVALYRIAQESLNNTIKHAQAKQITIDAQFEPEWVSMTIQDDGIGFDLQKISHHSLGLSIMQERAEKIGATFTVETIVGSGTSIHVHCPLKEKDD